MKTAIERKPKLREGLGVPIWFNFHGYKMAVQKFNERGKLLIISAPAATLRITRKASSADEGWIIEWNIRYSQQEEVNGRIILGSDVLRAAFGLSDKSGDFGDWVLEEFGGDSAEQGAYIRWGNHLSIPGPGTGHDRDPNISVWVDNEMQEAILSLLES